MIIKRFILLLLVSQLFNAKNLLSQDFPDTLFNENGKIESIQDVVNDSNKYFYYDEQDNLIETMQTYNNGKWVKEYAEYRNGIITSKYFYFFYKKKFSVLVYKIDSTYYEYDTSGNITETINYKNGVRNGFSTVFYPSGNVRSRIKYTKGYKDSTATYYYDDNSVWYQMHYSDKKIRWVKYYEGGELIKEQVFKRKKAEFFHYCNGVKTQKCFVRKGRVKKCKDLED
jgi:antitoxin component YwqK of YwqJK toxin-antitoxin module